MEADINYLFKIIVIGESGVGKSSLMKRYCIKSFDHGLEKTIGIDLSMKNMNSGKNLVKLRIWDTSGQERFGFLTNTYYNDTHGVLIVFDVTDSKSRDRVENWIEKVKENCRRENVPILIAANKIDKLSSDVVEVYSFPYPCIATSAKTGHNVDILFKTLVEKCIESITPKSESPLVSLNVERNENGKSKCFVCF